MKPGAIAAVAALWLPFFAPSALAAKIVPPAEAAHWINAKDLRDLTSAILTCEESLSIRRGQMATVTASICTVNLGSREKKLVCINSLVGAVESETYTSPGPSPLSDLARFAERHCGG